MAIFPAASEFFQDLHRAKLVVPLVLFALLWAWETWRPFFGLRGVRLRHAAHNLVLALLNVVVLGLVFGTALVLVADWTQRNQWGLLNHLPLSAAGRLLLAIVVLDAWMYLWHRANHVIPFLWRFHRVHHSDPHMDVTTATRFHLGEHVLSNVLRLGLIPLLGLHVWHVLLYDLLVVAVTQFHHADISLGRLDRPLRWLMVTPDMHKLHHSRFQPETDSNFSTVCSLWDRLAGTFTMRRDLRGVRYGLQEFDEPRWQSFWGMLRTPLAPLRRARAKPEAAPRAESGQRLPAAS